MPKIPTLMELLQAGVHFGHRVSKRHPKMAPYIFGARNGIHILDLDKTISHLKNTLEYVTDAVAKGGIVLFLGTKKQARGIIRKYAEECGMPYVTTRWLGGTLTNFSEVSGTIKRYNELKEEQASGALSKYTKKEQLQFTKFLRETEEKIGGIVDLKRTPDIMFVVDIQREKTAVKEAVSKGIPVVALADTNVNPDVVTRMIPSNDDAVKTIEMMVGLVAEAVKEGLVERGRILAEQKKAETKEKAAA
jgi:small subunit ribosomal protein S2